MSYLESFLNFPYIWYWVSLGVVVFALQIAPIFFEKHPNNPPLSPGLQRLLIWNAHLHAILCVWYLAVVYHFTPTILTPPEKHLYDIYIFGKLFEQVDKQYVLLTAATPAGTLNLKFIDQPLGYPWLALMWSQDRDALPAAWVTFVTLDQVHHILAYSYLGRLWGQRDGGALGKRVLQWSTLVHLVSGLLVDVGALVIRNFFDATYLGENWRNSTSTVILVSHLISALAEMTSVDQRATDNGMERLLEKIYPTLERLGLVAPRDTKTTPRTPTPTGEKEDGGPQPSADGTGPAAKDGAPEEAPARPEQLRRRFVGGKTVSEADD